MSMAVTYNNVMPDLRRLLVRLENAEAQAERCVAEVEAQAKERDVTVDRNAICALQVEISVIAAVLRVLVNAMAEDLRELEVRTCSN